MSAARSLWPDRDELGQCEANRETRYASDWEARHPDKRCAHTSSYEIGGKRYCKRHAGLAALRILVEGRDEFIEAAIKDARHFEVQRDELLETVVELLNGPECGGDQGAIIRRANALVASVKWE